jgi:hypothetical protein
MVEAAASAAKLRADLWLTVREHRLVEAAASVAKLEPTYGE